MTTLTMMMMMMVMMMMISLVTVAASFWRNAQRHQELPGKCKDAFDDGDADI